jgi:eukaryotic-like serine/threonine-protein kinase
VFVASGDGPQRLWVRTLDKTDARALAATDGASLPFWSPDSLSIGYFARGKLYRVDIAGGTPQALANAPVGRGGAWSADGTIVFAATAFSPLLKMSASGGEAVPVTRIELPRKTGNHFPKFLPDGHQFLYYVQGVPEVYGIYLSSLDGSDVGSDATRLVSADAAALLPPNTLIFERESALFAQRLDVKAGALTGEPRRLVDAVGSDGVSSGHGGFSVSASGVIAYRTVSAAMRQLRWFDRSGRAIGAVGEPQPSMSNPGLSKNGQRIAVQINPRAFPDIWVFDLVRGGLTRFTFGPANSNTPVWSPDGTAIAYSSNRTGPNNLYLRSSNQNADQMLLETAVAKYVRDWSPDGRYLLYSSDEPKGGRDLLALPMSGADRTPIPVATTSFDENNGQFSPDGQWVAYETNESGSRVKSSCSDFRDRTEDGRSQTAGGSSRDGVWTEENSTSLRRTAS